MKEKIEKYIRSLGLDTFGFIPMRAFTELREFYEMRQQKNLQNEFEEKNIELRIHPSHYMEDGRTILSIAFPYYHTGENVENGFSIYTKRRDYHNVVQHYLNQICKFIEGLGGKALGFVDSNTLPERYIAYLGGVGFIGRNNMIITKKYGSYVFLGEILTDLEFPCQDMRTLEEIKGYTECGECRACYQECPSKSINAAKINPSICLSYLTQKKELELAEINLLKDNVFGCDYCQLKCPYNQEVITNVLEEFATLPEMNEPLTTYSAMDNRYFKEKISQTSCGWRGKNVLRRNAIVQLAKQGEEIEQYRGDSPYINKYVDLLQNEQKSSETKS